MDTSGGHTQKLFIPIVLGTARTERNSEQVARFLHTEAAGHDFDTAIVDVKDMVTWGATTIPAWVDDPRTHPWRELVIRADGFIFVIPEYNHGYPGEFKLLLDSAYKEYRRKPAVICGVSDGHFGGARLMDHIKPVLVELQLVPLRAGMNFIKTPELFDAEGTVRDAALEDRARAMLTELLWYARALKEAREKSS